jgi:hypothetical protein
MWNTTSSDKTVAIGDAEAVTVLQRLQRLRLSCCMTAPLTRHISKLTQLTSLEVIYDDINMVEVSEGLLVCCTPVMSLCMHQCCDHVHDYGVLDSSGHVSHHGEGGARR